VLKRRADVLRFPPKNNAWQAGRVLLLRELQTVLNFRTAERQHCITAARFTIHSLFLHIPTKCDILHKLIECPTGEGSRAFS
jgi:hypothetical protein